MKIIFENHPYPAEDVISVVPEWMLKNSSDSEHVILPYVGYIYSSKISDIIFFLPKIFIDEKGMAFGTLSPKSFIHINSLKDLNNHNLTSRLYSLSMWIYESIRIYKSRHADDEIKIFTDYSAGNLISYKKGSSPHTMMELYYSFQQFYKNNKNIFIRYRYLGNKGHKTVWNRTINMILPIIQNNQPFYIEKKTRMYRKHAEDQLLVLFFSVLNFFKNKYGCRIEIDSHYALISGYRFDNLLEGKGIRILKKIRTSYFSDVFVKLWKLLFSFFDFYSTVILTPEYEEALLTNNYPGVFENMVDMLIGDSASETDIPRFYKDQKDGKIVDHIYKDSDLFSDSDIYFIGDSKYYKVGSLASGISVEKQFTYAKNVIQYSCDPYRVHARNNIRYRDDVTEGYNITPNFFISAVVDRNYDASSDNIETAGMPEIRCQFKNRLFDRDTMVVHRYNINFLYVLSAYISKDGYAKESFRYRARAKFRADIIDYINKNYMLFCVFPDSSSDIENIINKRFRDLIGKVYSLKNERRFFIYAHEKHEINDFSKVPNTDKTDFKYIKDYLMSIDGVKSVTEYMLS